MRVYEAIGETLKKLDVRATFGLMGDGNLRFMTHLAHEFGMPYRRPYIIGPFAVFCF